MWISAMQLVGLGVLILEIWATIVNSKARKQTEKTDKKRKYYFLAWILGIPLGIASVFMWFPTQGNHGQQYQIIGIPFIAGAFDEKGADYISPLTPILMGINFIFWFLTPQLYIWGKWLGNKRKRNPPDAITNQEDTPA
jgi:hypothetical protein